MYKTHNRIPIPIYDNVNLHCNIIMKSVCNCGTSQGNGHTRAIKSHVFMIQVLHILQPNKRILFWTTETNQVETTNSYPLSCTLLKYFLFKLVTKCTMIMLGHLIYSTCILQTWGPARLLRRAFLFFTIRLTGKFRKALSMSRERLGTMSAVSL